MLSLNILSNETNVWILISMRITPMTIKPSIRPRQKPNDLSKFFNDSLEKREPKKTCINFIIK